MQCVRDPSGHRLKAALVFFFFFLMLWIPPLFVSQFWIITKAGDLIKDQLPEVMHVWLFFTFLYTDEVLASKWIGISQRNSYGNIWSFPLKLHTHTHKTHTHKRVFRTRRQACTDPRPDLGAWVFWKTLSACGDKSTTICLTVTNSLKVWKTLCG